MDLASLATFIAAGTPLVYFAQNYLRNLPYARSEKWAKWNGFITITLTILVGIGVAFLFSESQFQSGVGLDGFNAADLSIAGLMLAAANTLVDKKIKADDNAQSAETPKLVG